MSQYDILKSVIMSLLLNLGKENIYFYSGRQGVISDINEVSLSFHLIDCPAM